MALRPYSAHSESHEVDVSKDTALTAKFDVEEPKAH